MDRHPDLARVDGEKLAPFRFRVVGQRVLITNDYGRFRLLSRDEFARLVEGRLDPQGPLYEQLAGAGFIRDRLDFSSLTQTWRRRNRFLWHGPSLHVVVVTLRCNHRCLYCHASSVPMHAQGCDMSEETARRVVDRIFETTSPAVTIEFQGGEPLANWPVVQFMVEYALAKNETAKKGLWLNLVSNLTLLDDEKLEWLLKRGVNFCTSLDGPADLHDKNRVFSGGGGHAQVMRWLKRIRERTKGRTFTVDALTTVTRHSLHRGKDIVDAYRRAGARGIFLRPLNKFGLAVETWNRIGYTADEFLAFYEETFDYILAVNRRRTFFEQNARLFLAKILSDEDPNFLDLRSPCGAGIGQLAYNYDGSIYTCDEGRMLSRMGDETFCIGHAAEGAYAGVVGHDTVRAMAVSSCLDNQPECSQCAYKPYCGICPIQCYAEQGDIMGRMPSNSRCRVNKGILDILFKRLEDPANLAVFRKWLKKRDDPLLYQRH